MNTPCRYLSQAGQIILAQGGLETTLEFKTDFQLREFSAYEAALSEKWKYLVAKDFEGYLRMAARHDIPLILDAPTWRASPNWFEKLGTSESDRESVYSRTLADANAVIQSIEKEVGKISVLVQGVIGPMGDGYCVKDAPSVEYSRKYHASAVEAWKKTNVTEISAITITSSNEAAGIALNAAVFDLPLSISFVLTVHGKLPSGETLGEAISFVDNIVEEKKPMCYLINCIHPKYVAPVLSEAVKNNEQWLRRVGGVRGNASEKSHEELDCSTSLDEGDPKEWAKHMVDLLTIVPHMRVLGGCCGTDVKHIDNLAQLVKSHN